MRPHGDRKPFCCWDARLARLSHSVLNLLYQAYGFAGAMPRADMDPTRVLSAPQPAIVTMIASGIFRQNLDWSMLSIGAGTGITLVVLDRILRFRGLALPPLAVGIGIYLPPSVSTTLAIGACLGWVVKKLLLTVRGSRTKAQ